MNQEGGAQNYQEYFYGKESVSSDVSVDPELLVVPENLEELKLKMEQVKSELDQAMTNEDKHQQIKGNSLYKIEEEALTPEVKNAGKVVEILQNQQKVLGAKILEMKPAKGSWRKKFASFLGIFS